MELARKMRGQMSPLHEEPRRGVGNLLAGVEAFSGSAVGRR